MDDDGKKPFPRPEILKILAEVKLYDPQPEERTEKKIVRWDMIIIAIIIAVIFINFLAVVGPILVTTMF